MRDLSKDKETIRQWPEEFAHMAEIPLHWMAQYESLLSEGSTSRNQLKLKASERLRENERLNDLVYSLDRDRHSLQEKLFAAKAECDMWKNEALRKNT